MPRGKALRPHEMPCRLLALVSVEIIPTLKILPLWELSFPIISFKKVAFCFVLFCNKTIQDSLQLCGDWRSAIVNH